MWVIFARAPPPDAVVWPGRRALALFDAVAWPVAWAAFVLGLRDSSGLVGLFAIALCVVSAFTRAHRAVAHNHRYHFTTWHWGRRFVCVLVFGYALKLAVLFSA